MNCKVGSFVVLCAFIARILAFNVDVKFPTTFSGELGSYFGYQVAFHPSPEGTNVLVTAPKGNSSLEPGIIEPGKLLKCFISVNSTGRNCQEVNVEKKRIQALPTKSRLGFVYDEGKDTMWLGVSLDVQRKEPYNVVVCAHRWHNKRYEFRVYGIFPLNGACYVLNSLLNSSEKLLPLLHPHRQISTDLQDERFESYYYAFGQAGMSAAFSERGEDLIMGAPGMFNWIGTALSFNNINDLRNLGSAFIPNPPFNQEISPDSYLGYSVTSGKFFHNQELYFVAGAPKDKSYNGRVYIFEALSHIKKVMFVRQKMSGEQMGAYFGAAVLSVNLNDDEYEDLLISAPLFSASKLAGDEGRLYVYISDGVSLQIQKQVIMGRKEPGARFGSAIAHCGDLNRDGFNDVAVGAPYENGHGAVYIYHGSSQGLQSQFSQVISASELFPTIRGFGISIARSRDIDHNLYPDLLVGAYASDSAILFRARTVIHIGMMLDISVPHVNLNDGPTCSRPGNVQQHPCFKVTACFSAESERLRPANITAVLQMDPSNQHMKRDQRGYLFHKGKPATTITENLTLLIGDSCFETEVDILEDNSLDYITPIFFRLAFDLLDETPTDSFCKDCPVLDPSSATSVTKQLPFLIGCGADNFCTADLYVEAALSNYREREELIHGANTSVTLEATVTNKGEPAYVSQLFVRLPSNVLVVNQGRCHFDNGSPLTGATLECKLGNPLKTQQTEKFSFKLDISKLESDIEEVKIEFEAVTTSRELNPLDNIFHLYLPFKALADITIKGFADRAVIAHKKDVETITVIHNYLVIKYLPSPVKSVGVAIRVPTATLNTDIPILTIESVEVGDGTSATVSGSCNVTFGNAESLMPSVDISGLLESNLTHSEKDTPNTIDLNNHVSRHFVAEALTDTAYVVSCNNTYCTTLICEVGPFYDSIRPALIRVIATVLYNNLTQEIGGRQNITILTEGRVWIKDYNYDIQPNNHRPDHTFVSTILIKQGPPPSKELPKWIIAISAGAGILLLGLIIFAMVRLGFFRRQKKEEMQNLLQQATVVDGDTFTNDITTEDEEDPDCLD